MPAILTKPIIVPEFGNGIVRLYTPTAGGGVQDNISYKMNLQQVVDTLFPGDNRKAAPNCCALLGADLFVTIDSHGGGGFAGAQAVVKCPNYLNDPAKAAQEAFIFTLDGGDYVGLAFDSGGDLFVAEDGQIVRYGGTDVAYPGAALAKSDNYASKVVLGNAGLASIFANLAFDNAGNLWVTDYKNSRLVVFLAGGLGQTNTTQFEALNNVLGSLAVATTNAALDDPVDRLFSKPEGLDFDGFGANASLWIGNNNDDTADTVPTTLVKITSALRSEILTKPIPTAVPNTNCFIYRMPRGTGGARPQIGGVQIDKAAGWIVLNEQVSNKGRTYELAKLATIPDSQTDGVIDMVSTNPGNGGLVMVGLGPFVADTAEDAGLEPDIGAVPHLSPAISVTANNLGTKTILPAAEAVPGGAPAYFYVEVRNFDQRVATRGNEVLELRWAKASAGLDWPAPWDGSEVDTDFPTSSLGGTIRSVPISKIGPGSSAIVGPIQWASTPDPSKYAVNDGHFCVLARIRLPGFGADGMSFPEGESLTTNIRGNAHVALRNIHILAVGANKRLGVMVANYGVAAMDARIAIDVLNAAGDVLRDPPGEMRIVATGTAREVLGRSSLGRVWTEGETFVLPPGEQGIDHLPLAPGEVVAFALDYLADRPGEAFAVHISQYARDAEGERLIGGQTFVSGHVAGLTIPPPGGRRGAWLWLLLALLVALIALALLRTG